MNETERKKILLVSDSSGYRNYRFQKLSKISPTLQDEYIKHLETCKKLYYDEYPFLYRVKETKITLYDSEPEIRLQRYQPNRYYSELHCENDGMYTKRCLVFMTYLNTIEDGGGTIFPQQDMEIKSEQGLTLLWPAYFTHPHIGKQTKHVKHILTGWFEFTD